MPAEIRTTFNAPRFIATSEYNDDTLRVMRVANTLAIEIAEGGNLEALAYDLGLAEARALRDFLNSIDLNPKGESNVVQG